MVRKMKLRMLAAVLTTGMLAATTDTLADAAPGSAIHGFGSVQVSNDYITPRGLLVTNKGMTVQALAGIVFLLPDNFSVVAGGWNDLDDFHHEAGGAGNWIEEDFFFGVNYQLTKQIKLSATYDSWNFPGEHGSIDNEQNMEFTAAFDDSRPDSAFSIQPHASVFWAVSSRSSTVVLGRPATEGTEAYLELGATPTLAVKSLGITLTVPSWISVGPTEFWCDKSSGAAMAAASITGKACSSSSLGVFSTGLTAKTNAGFIPQQYGNWYLYLGAQYFNLLNSSLVEAQALTVGDLHGKRNVVNGFAGIGFGF